MAVHVVVSCDAEGCEVRADVAPREGVAGDMGQVEPSYDVQEQQGSERPFFWVEMGWQFAPSGWRCRDEGWLCPTHSGVSVEKEPG